MILHMWVKYMNKNARKIEKIVIILLFIIISAISTHFNIEENQTNEIIEYNKSSYEISNIPKYCGEIYVEINNNIPNFTAEDINMNEDYYSKLENGRVRNGDGEN